MNVIEWLPWVQVAIQIQTLCFLGLLFTMVDFLLESSLDAKYLQPITPQFQTIIDVTSHIFHQAHILKDLHTYPYSKCLIHNIQHSKYPGLLLHFT